MFGLLHRSDDRQRGCVVEVQVEKGVEQLFVGQVEVNDRVESVERSSQIVLTATSRVEDRCFDLRRVAADLVVVPEQCLRDVAFGKAIHHRVEHRFLGSHVRQEVAHQQPMSPHRVFHRGGSADGVGGDAQHCQLREQCAVLIA